MTRRTWVNMALLVVLVSQLGWLVPRCQRSLGFRYAQCWDARGDLLFRGHVLGDYAVDNGALTVTVANDGQTLTFVNTWCVLAPERKYWRNRPE